MKKICKNVKTQKCKNYSTLCSSSKTSELRIALFKKTAKKQKISRVIATYGRKKNDMLWEVEKQKLQPSKNFY